MKIVYDYAMSLLWVQYRWGGENPLVGFDCSGLCQELLRSVGLDPLGDQTAQGLYDYFSSNGSINQWGCGALAFYGESVKKVVHVGMCLDNYRMIEAGGGDSSVVDLATAQAKGACVRLRPIKGRKDFLCVIKPFFRTIGQL